MTAKPRAKRGWLPKIEHLGPKGDPYLSRLVWGRLRVHVFHRGDADPDAHDHQWDFWTLPLVDYVEINDDGYAVVERFRVHFRPAEYRHRVIGSLSWWDRFAPHRRIVTLVWTGPKRRKWGFWRAGAFVPWDEYIQGSKNVGADDPRLTL